MKEKEGYREQLETIIKFFPDKELLSVSDVARFTGLSRPTVAKRYPFNEHHQISRTTLARKIC